MTLRDVIYLAGAGFFVLFLGLLVTHFITGQIFANLKATQVISGTAAEDIIDSGQSIMNQLDKIAIAGFFAIFLAFIITSWFTAGNPVLTIVYFLGGIAAVIISMFMSNFWEDITNTSQLVSSLGYFPFANHIMLNLPVYIAIFFVIGLAIVFGKPTSASGDGAY